MHETGYSGFGVNTCTLPDAVAPKVATASAGMVLAGQTTFIIVPEFISSTWVNMVPTGSDKSKLRTFQGPFQDQISHYKDFYGEFHNANIPNTPHICGNFLLFSF